MLPFVQFEFTHALGPQPGRYVVASADLAAPADAAADAVTGVRRSATEGDVLVLAVVGGPAPLRGGGILRRPRPRAVDADAPAAPVPLLRATLAGAARPFDDAAAARAWLDRAEEEAPAWIAAGLGVLNLAIRAHRLASADPYAVEVTALDARTVRLGYATGEQVSHGDWEAAVALPAPEGGGRSARDEALRTAASVAAALGGRGVLLEAEDIALHGLLDLQHGRTRAAALALRAAVELAEAEVPGAELPAGARERAGELAGRALERPLARDEADAVHAALGDVVRALTAARTER